MSTSPQYTDNLGVVPARKTIWGQEPAFWTMFAQALIVLLVAFGLNLTQNQTGAIIAVVNGVIGVILAFSTRPINVGVFVTLFQVLFTLIATFKLDITTEQIGSATAFLGMILFLLVRQQVVPLKTLQSGQVETQPGLPAGV